jgi:hypothetical protein
MMPEPAVPVLRAVEELCVCRGIVCRGENRLGRPALTP